MRVCCPPPPPPPPPTVSLSLSPAGMDYEDKTGTFMFDSTSDLRQCVNIGIVDDTMSEVDEIFQVSLMQSTSGGVVTGVATVTIVDNDPQPVTVIVEQTQYSIDEEGGSLEVCLVVVGTVVNPVDILIFSSDVIAQGKSLTLR